MLRRLPVWLLRGKHHCRQCIIVRQLLERPTSAAWLASASCPEQRCKAVVEVSATTAVYMTGGAWLSSAYRQKLWAGMSGSIAYVLDQDGTFPLRCNHQMVTLEALEEAQEIEEVWQMLRKHWEYTRSRRAEAILETWEDSVSKFVKVIPRDYKRMIEAIKRARKLGLGEDEAVMVAFEENLKDVSRVSGN